MKNSKMYISRLVILAAIFCLGFAYNGKAQEGVILETLDVPSSVTMYQDLQISGTFRNTGTSTYNGPIGINVEVMDFIGATETHFIPAYQVQVMLAPGETVGFTATVPVTPDEFTAAGHDVVIIYPIAVNLDPNLNPPVVKSIYIQASNTLPGTNTGAATKSGGGK